jgi:hypothetical protein
VSDNNTVIIFLYNRLFDPVIQSNFWLYIKDYLDQPQPGLDFHLVTYEDPSYPLTPQQKELVNRWKACGLEWSPLRWHPGFGLREKFIDILQGLMLVTRLRFGGARHIMALGSVAGTFTYVYARILFMRLLLYQFEPHSELSRDAGAWPEKSLQFKISRFLEHSAARYAAVIASGTRFMRDRLRDEWGVKAKFVQIPTVANDRKFKFDESLRQQVRDELGLSDQNKVIYYAGKFGGLYYGIETALFYRWLWEIEPSLRMLVVTPHEDAEVHHLFDRANVVRDSYHIRHSSYDEIHRYHFAGDIGLVTIPPGPSQFFRSSIKVGEYLCAGLPFITSYGVSEDFLYAQEQDVGVVVSEFSEAEVKDAWPRINSYLRRDPVELRAHCRRIGLEYRGFDALNPKFRNAINYLRSR